MPTRSYTLKQGTLIRINGRQVNTKRDARAHLVTYALPEDILVSDGVGLYVRGSVVHRADGWHHTHIGTTFKEEYDEILAQNNREAARLFLTSD